MNACVLCSDIFNMSSQASSKHAPAAPSAKSREKVHVVPAAATGLASGAAIHTLSASGNGQHEGSPVVPLPALSPEWPLAALGLVATRLLALGRVNFSGAGLHADQYTSLLHDLQAKVGVMPTLKSLQGKLHRLKQQGWTPQTLSQACARKEVENKAEQALAQRTTQAAAKEARGEGSAFVLT